MGVCSNTAPKSAKHGQIDLNLPMKFNICFGNMKIRSSQNLENVKIVVQVGKFHRFETEERYNISNPSWRINKKFKIHNMIAGDLYNESFILDIYKGNNIKLGSAKLLFFEVATGPAFNNFEIKQKNFTGKFSFIIFMSQIINLKIQTEKLFVQFDHPIRHQSYAFNLKMFHKKVHIESKFSTEFLNPKFIHNLESPTKSRKNSLSKLNLPSSPTLKKGFFSMTPSNAELNQNDNMDFDENIEDRQKVNYSKKVKFFSKIISPENSPPISSIPSKKFSSLVGNHLDTSEIHNFDKDSIYHYDGGSQPESFKDMIMEPALARRESYETFSRPGRAVSIATKKHATLVENDKLTDKLKKNRNERNGLSSFFQSITSITWPYKGTASINLPEIEVPITITDITNACFQICIWGKVHASDHDYEFEQSQSGMSVHENDTKVVATTHISLNKIFTNIFSQAEKNKIYFENKGTKTVESRIMHQGHELGELLGEFKVSNFPFVRQLLCGSRTEKGFYPFSKIQLDKKNIASSHLNPRLQMLKTKTEELKNLHFSLFKENAKNLQNKIMDCIFTIKDLIQKTDIELVKTYKYASREDLFEGQKVMIELGDHLLEFINSASDICRDDYYETLKLLFERTEFELSNMGFDPENDYLLNKNTGNAKVNLKIGSMKLLKEKLKIATSFQKLLYATLDKALQCFNKHDMIDNEKILVENFLALAYFKIPDFRYKVLSLITAEENTTLPILFVETYLDDASSKNFNALYSIYFDWKKRFYDYLETQEKGKENNNYLTSILKNQQWQLVFIKKKSAFFSFVTEWANYVDKTIIFKQKIEWSELPGYYAILRGVLYVMNQRKIKRYSDSMILATKALLKNEKILSIFMLIVFKKANLQETVDLFQTFEFINEWFECFFKNKTHLPNSFDQAFFNSAILKVLKSDHGYCISKVLWVLYNNFPVFWKSHQKELGEMLIKNLFSQFFLHWSFSVRDMFYHFLCYRIYGLLPLLDDPKYSALAQIFSSHFTYKCMKSDLQQSIDHLNAEKIKYTNFLKSQVISINRRRDLIRRRLHGKAKLSPSKNQKDDINFVPPSSLDALNLEDNSHLKNDEESDVNYNKLKEAYGVTQLNNLTNPHLYTPKLDVTRSRKTKSMDKTLKLNVSRGSNLTTSQKKYLDKSLQEFQKVYESYKGWLKKKESLLNEIQSKEPETKKKLMTYYDIPPITIILRHDKKEEEYDGEDENQL